MQQIFEPYFTTKPPEEGTVMGLSITYGIVKNLDGFIHVQSEPGKGTIFHVYFPSIITQDNEAKHVMVESLPTGSEHILFVDDEKALVELFSQMLERLGYTVSARTSAHDALKLFRDYPESFDMVISDLTMPKMRGDILTRELQRIKPGLPVIICTGYGNIRDLQNDKDIGALKIIRKPVAIRNLATTIRQML